MRLVAALRNNVSLVDFAYLVCTRVCGGLGDAVRALVFIPRLVEDKGSGGSKGAPVGVF
jgi:cytochrome oxidase Cu insertion factor (SCO1/SenC/PrrC family)